MVRLSIDESVGEELVWIGCATGKGGLSIAMGRRIDDLNNHQNIDDARWPSGAEKAAIKCGWRLEVSWAETPAPEAHKAALVKAHGRMHGHRPWFECPQTGEHELGTKSLVLKKGESHNDLDWQPWHDLRGLSKSSVPHTHGLYRIRAVQP